MTARTHHGSPGRQRATRHAGRISLVSLVVVVVASACASDDTAPEATTVAVTPPVPPTTTVAPATTPASPTSTEAPGPDPDRVLERDGDFPEAPEVPTGPLDAAVIADLDAVFSSLTTTVDVRALARLGESGDARLGWLLSDLLRFFQGGPVLEAAVTVFEEITDTNLGRGFPWRLVTDAMIAWDLPAPPGYVGWKRTLFELVEPAWEPFFTDEDSAIDYRLLSWGGVLIDDRSISDAAAGRRCEQGCIPALNDPEVTNAAGGSWLSDERLIFGVVVNGEARAYPKHMMEVHEMVNDTLGGRRIAMPYCTLCGSAQAYYTDVVPDGFETLELRTSGLLSRSNKVMFDLHTFSVFDTFLGEALTGPLRDERFRLEMISVVTSTWGDWKAAHPDTTIVARDAGIGRRYELDPLRGRDDDGPIFPIGDVDPRLPVQEQVLGVVAPDGTAVAFPVEAARRAVDAGEVVELAGVSLIPEGSGFRAELVDGSPIVSHQAFWFAWSQFHEDTLVWTPIG